MSSSERLHRPPIHDLRADIPEQTQPEFNEQLEFVRTIGATAPPLTVEEAHRNGIVEGEQRGRAAALKELEPVIEEFRSTIHAMTQVRSQRLSDAEDELVSVATDIAQRILRGELQLGNDVVLRMARACIEEAKGEGPMTLKVSPSELDLVRVHLPELELEASEDGLRLQADPQLGLGCVLLETERRCYDGRPERILESGLAQLEAAENSE